MRQRRRIWWGNLLLGMALSVVLAGCASNPYFWDRDTQKEIDRSLETAGKTTANNEVPAEVSQALLPSLGVRAPDGGSAPLEARFDLSVNNASVRQVMMGLVEGTPYSMVVHPDVSGAISLHLKDVTVPEAMEAIRRVFGYEYKREGNRFFVLGHGMQTRIFPVNYLNLNRKGKSDTRITSGELTQSSSGGSSGGTTTSRVPSIQVQTESQADFWKELSEVLTTLIGNGDGRQVVVNPQTGLVIVRAMPDELRIVEDYLGITHATVNRQVVLEAKILSVQLNDRYQTGINWAALQGSSTFGQTGGGTIFSGTGASEIAGNFGNLTGVLPSGTSTSAFGGVFSVAINATNFAAFVEALKAQGDVRVLSSPRVSTVNNQKAVIKVGGDDFFITGITLTNTTSGTTTNQQPNVEVVLTPFFSGIALDVTPQIDDSDNIILHIHPSVSEVSQKDRKFTINGLPNVLPLAASSIQESDNVVRAQSGQFVVIGGLMKEASTDDNASVPFLGDIPVVGNLFKHKRVTRIKSELVIVLKPTLVDNGQVWNNSVHNARDRVQKLRRD